MRYGFWLPVFGGWLRNVDDEQMEASWEYFRALTKRGEKSVYDLTLNLVASWWKDEATKYGVHFDEHDDRYARTSEWLDVVNGCWNQQGFSYQGKFYDVRENVLAPNPVRKPRPPLFGG